MNTQLSRFGALALIALALGANSTHAIAQLSLKATESRPLTPLSLRANGSRAITEDALTLTPVGAGRFNIQVKQTSLALALHDLYKAAGNPQHVINASAQTAITPAMTIANSDWHSAVKELAERSGFAMRDENQICFVQKKSVEAPDVAKAVSPNGETHTPLTSSNSGVATLPEPNSLVNIRNAQTLPNLGGTTSADQENQQIIPLYVRHIYVGGIAQLFKNSSTVGTQPFVSPLNNNGFGGRGMGGMMGGMGGMGMGGMMGGMGGMGMGGMMGGMGGMGMGGMMGGMGGMGMGGMMGGMGGMMGGMGGGMMGGMGGFGRRF